MSWARRAFWGAFLGAVLTLFLHPASRPFLLTASTQLGESDLISAENWPWDLPQSPQSALDCAKWMDAGAQQIVARTPIAPKALADLQRVALLGASREPRNAFWKQMAAVFAATAGERDRARGYWRSAADLPTWDDHQTGRLLDLRSRLGRQVGSENAWQYAAVYPLRSRAPSVAIESYARELIRQPGLWSENGQPTLIGLRLRFATLINGNLIRVESKAVAVGQAGSNMIELSSYPPSIGPSATPRKLLLARTDLINDLKTHNLEALADRAHQVFLENDGWTAFIQPTERREHLQLLTGSALAAITVPGALLIVALVGALLWGFGNLLTRSAVARAFVEPPLAPVIGIALAIGVYMLTQLPLAALAISACFAFVCFTPVRERSHPPADLGPLFGFTLLVLGATFIVLLVAFIVTLSTPGHHLLKSLGAPREYYSGSPVLLGLAGIVLSLLLLVAPSWAVVQHIATTSVVTITLKRFGRSLLTSAFVLAILLTPVAFRADQLLSDELRGIVQSEWVYYYVSE